jgi:DNA polymerase
LGGEQSSPSPLEAQVKNEIFVLGEAWGAEEAKARTPFVGASGYELTRMLDEAGIHRADCYLSNVLNLHPLGNDIESLCGGKPDGIVGYPSLRPAKYLRKEFTPELERLADELVEIDPNLVLALGNTALWALSGKTVISKLRGATMLSTHCASGFKVLPTYHPAAVLRQWDLRPIVVIDFQKALRESAYPDLRRPFREIYIEPDLKDCHDFFEKFIPKTSLLSVDIETSGRRVTCIGFAPSPRYALVIPFVDKRRLGGNYWATRELECEVWGLVKGVLENPHPPKLFQNGLYDISFLFRSYGIRVAGATDDTMLLHHALQPESRKDLGFLGATYADEGAWKQMRAKKTTKKED